jgi:hypothetical protein
MSAQSTLKAGLLATEKTSWLPRTAASPQFLPDTATSPLLTGTPGKQPAACSFSVATSASRKPWNLTLSPDCAGATQKRTRKGTQRGCCGAQARLLRATRARARLLVERQLEAAGDARPHDALQLCARRRVKGAA